MGINPESLGVDLNAVEYENASGPYSDNCLRTARAAGYWLVGDSQRPDVPPFAFSQDEMAAFVERAKQGYYDQPSDAQ